MTTNIRQIQILALLATEQPNWEAIYRSICRQYSKTFNTPLHTVENELSEEYVLQHYYENIFYDLYNDPADIDHSKYEKIKQDIIDPEAAKKAEDEDEEWVKEMEEELKEQQGDVEPENPNINIEDDIDISVSVDDDPPEF